MAQNQGASPNNILRPQQPNRKPQPSLTDHSPEAQYNFQFYQQYKKLHETKLELSIKIRALTRRKQSAWEKLTNLQHRTQQFKDNIRGQARQRKKRSRRMADQIQREYRCTVERCNKSYGKEGSLSQHYKLKHPDIYWSTRKKPGQRRSSEQSGANNYSSNEVKDEELQDNDDDDDQIGKNSDQLQYDYELQEESQKKERWNHDRKGGQNYRKQSR